MNEIKDLKWFMFDQNNSGGSFDVDDKVCHRLFIEAESFSDAVEKAEELGCYWDGVDKGIDCSCCGDRWSKLNDSPIDIEKYKTEGYKAVVYDGIYAKAETRWGEKYGKYEVVEEPTWQKTYSCRKYVGKIRFRNVEEYAQYVADEYGWTTPDARIYYNNGNIKEIFSDKSRY